MLSLIYHCGSTLIYYLHAFIHDEMPLESIRDYRHLLSCHLGNSSFKAMSSWMLRKVHYLLFRRRMSKKYDSEMNHYNAPGGS